MNNVPEKIGDYRVLYPAGKGGMAEVFAVEKTGPGGFEKKLCLKRIRRDLAKDEEFIKSFESEARLVAALDHPNIVQVFDFFRHEGDLCLVMELVDGMDLNGLLRIISGLGVQLPVTAAVYILESLLRALEYAHRLNVKGQDVCIIHRDISPQNLLISNVGTVKLADFGIAKAQGMTPETSGSCLKGKLSYLAPERLKSGATPIGPESDLFSAGIVFWEMLATRRLFKATMEHQVLSKVMHFEKAPIDYLTERMNRFLEKLLAPSPEARFHSADEALFALKEAGVQPCTQGDIARLVREAKKINALTVAQEAREMEEAEEEAAHTADAIPLVNISNEVVESVDLETGRVSRYAAGGEEDRRFLPWFSYLILAGVILAAVAVGIRWFWNDEPREVETTQDAVKTTMPPDDLENRDTQEPELASDGSNATTGSVVLPQKESAGPATSALQGDDTASAKTVSPPKGKSKRSRPRQHSKKKYEKEENQPTGDDNQQLDLLPIFAREEKQINEQL